jgi:hypothetical protein
MGIDVRVMKRRKHCSFLLVWVAVVPEDIEIIKMTHRQAEQFEKFY